MSIPLVLLREKDVSDWLQSQPAPLARWVATHGFKGERARTLSVAGSDGGISLMLAGVGDLRDWDNLTLWHAAGLGEKLPAGKYTLTTPLGERAATQFLLGWLIGQYRFTRFRTAPSTEPALLEKPAGADSAYAHAAAQAIAAARDLINLPANELGPAELAAAVQRLADEFGAECRVHEAGSGAAPDFPLLGAVGAGSPRAPCMVELLWGGPTAAPVTLIGKGVCFDSGGLDIKPSAAMLLMKKDMGGAACALGTARLLMQLNAPVRLRLLIPAAENSVDGRAFRPGDVLRSRKGLTVEIGNTDAEGRLILADALALADESPPALMIDFATLTGAARVALGPELPAAFSSDARLLEEFVQAAAEEHDPVWPMPLWEPYDDELASRIADLNNVSASGFAGAIVAALFLKRFVTQTVHWVHLDLYAWNPKERAGRPVGAEAQCIRAVYKLIRQRFG